MKLSLEFYNSYEEHITEIENVIINEYINKYKNGEYEKIFETDNRLDVILALSELRQNIISWYPFKKQCHILEIGGNLGEITGVLCDNAEKVVTVESSKIKAQAISKRHEDRENLEIIAGELENIKFEEKFDYIVAIGINENTIFNKLKELLKDDGVILTAFDNKFGVNYFSTIKSNGEDLITETTAQSLDNIDKVLNALEMKRKLYFVLTDYKLSNVIFSEQFAMTQENITRNITYNDKNDIKIYNQNDIYRKILEEKNADLFKIFANSFLLEIFKNEYIENGIKFISFSNMRKSQYRIKTIITDNEVIKSNMSLKSKEHINTIKRNIDCMNNNKLKTIDTYNENQIKSQFQDAKTLDNVIIEKLKNQEIEEGFDLILKFKKELIENLTIDENKENNAFDKFEIKYDEQDIQSLHFTPNGLFDLIFQNCFYINNEFYFYDQEWMEEKIPIEFILYRSIVYCEGIRKYIPTEELLDKLGITEKQEELFKQLDDKIQHEIRNDNIWQLNNSGINMKDMHIQILTLQHQINLSSIQNNELREENEELKKNYSSIVNSRTWKIIQHLKKSK